MIHTVPTTFAVAMPFSDMALVGTGLVVLSVVVNVVVVNTERSEAPI